MSLERDRIDRAVLRMALRMADECARSDIEIHCGRRRVRGVTWLVVGEEALVDAHVWWCVAQARRYLELRGLLLRHPHMPELARFKERRRRWPHEGACPRLLPERAPARPLDRAPAEASRT